MHKFRAWAVMMIMMMAVFAVSGCGGGSLDPENSSEETEQTIPNNSPDSYNTQKILQGTWYTLDEENTFSTYYFSFRLNSARLTFESVDITGTVAQSKVTSYQEWYAYYGGEESTYDDYIGMYTLGLDFAGYWGTMAHQGRDKWRCNVKNTVMNITVISETVIDVNFQGVQEKLDGVYDAPYNFTLTFRKDPR